MSDDAVPVYVRKGATDDERVLTFRVPASVDPVSLLDHGFAIDGNQAVAFLPLRELLERQMWLRAYLAEAGCAMRFA